MAQGTKPPPAPEIPIYPVWLGVCLAGSFGWHYAKANFGIDAVKSINVFLGSLILGGVLGYFITKLGISLSPMVHGIRFRLPAKEKHEPPQ